MLSGAMSEKTRLLIGFDGSDAAAGAIRAAAALFPDIDAVVVCVRGAPLTGDLARAALTDPVFVGAAQELERTAGAHASEVAERGAAAARDAGLRGRRRGRGRFGAVARSLRRGRGARCEHRGLWNERARRLLARRARYHVGPSLAHHAALPVLVVPTGAEAFEARC